MRSVYAQIPHLLLSGFSSGWKHNISGLGATWCWSWWKHTSLFLSIFSVSSGFNPDATLVPDFDLIPKWIDSQTPGRAEEDLLLLRCLYFILFDSTEQCVSSVDLKDYSWFFTCRRGSVCLRGFVRGLYKSSVMYAGRKRRKPVQRA